MVAFCARQDGGEFALNFPLLHLISLHFAHATHYQRYRVSCRKEQRTLTDIQDGRKLFIHLQLEADLGSPYF